MENKCSISILIMDDSEHKTTAIKNLLIDECGLSKESIDTASTINEGRTRLRNSYYDLLILDLVMPNLTGEEADHEAAPKFIDEIYEGHGFKLPNQIIGFTAYDEEYENLKLRFEEKLWSIIKYSQGEINWKNRIRSKVNHLLNSKSRLIESIISKNKFDVGIICALSEEFLEMKKAFGDKWKRENDIDFPVPIYSTELVTANANTIRICALCIGEVGLVPATAMTTAMILTFSPQALFMTGITAGFKDRDLKLGDLVISKSVSEPIIGKIVGDDNKIELKREYHVLKTDVKLYGYAQELSSDVEFISDFNKHLKTINLLQEGSNLKIICAPTVSVPFVVGNGALMEKLKGQGDRKLTALDMEGYGMYHSSNLLNVPCIWIKSVSDLGDTQKDDKYHKIGAYASGYFIYKLIKETL
ncbi:MAG: hypothetical protein NC453_21555 [Muribaculum sp.]|nr:hypothetical protein [Muribaculum sp.]